MPIAARRESSCPSTSLHPRCSMTLLGSVSWHIHRSRTVSPEFKSGNRARSGGIVSWRGAGSPGCWRKRCGRHHQRGSPPVPAVRLESAGWGRSAPGRRRSACVALPSKSDGSLPQVVAFYLILEARESIVPELTDRPWLGDAVMAPGRNSPRLSGDAAEMPGVTNRVVTSPRPLSSGQCTTT